MVSITSVLVVSLALFTTAIAAPTAQDSTALSPSNYAPLVYDPKTMNAVEFMGMTIYSTFGMPKNDTSALQARYIYCGFSTNNCGDSSFNPYPGPYPTVADCEAIAQYAYTLNTCWIIQSEDLVWGGSCVFYAETSNIENTGIGSQDIGDLVQSSIDKLQYGGLVAATGQMGCNNEITGLFGQGQSAVRWRVTHY